MYLRNSATFQVSGAESSSAEVSHGSTMEGEGCKWLEIMGKWYSGLQNLTWQKKKKWDCDSGLLKGLKIVGIVTRGSELERQDVVIKESEAHSCDVQGDLVNGTDQGG